MSSTSFNGIAVLSVPAVISATPVTFASLPWNGVSKPYQWTVTLGITVQNQSNNQTTSRQKYVYNGLDVNVGQWIGALASGLAWQIVSITSKTSTSVTCVVQDIFRYNTYRDPTKSGKGTPSTGNYVVFTLAENGTPLIDPAPAGIGANFLSTLTARFAYVNNQDDFALSQPGNATVSFKYGDIIAVHEATQTFVEADTADPTTVIGRVTAVDDTGTIFTINSFGKIVGTFNSLPGQVGSLLYTDPNNVGQLTATAGGTEVYIKLRNNTNSTTSSNSLASNVTPVTTVGYTFNVNNVLATIGGTGLASDVVAAINATTSTSGVSAILNGSGPYFIVSTAIDARAIAFEDIAGSVTTDVGLISVENGIKAAAMSVPYNGGTGSSFGSTNEVLYNNGTGVVGTTDFQFENSDGTSTLTIGDGNPNNLPGIVQGPNGIGIIIKGGHSNGNTTNAALFVGSNSDVSGNSGAGSAVLTGGGAQGAAPGGDVTISSGAGGINGTIYLQNAGNTIASINSSGINVPGPGANGTITTTASDSTFGDPSFVISSSFGLTLSSGSQELALESNNIYFSTGTAYGGVSSDNAGGLNIYSNGNLTLSMQGGLVIIGSGYNSAGNPGDVLTSQGGSANPRWVTPPAPPSGFVQTYGFVYTQSIATTSWTINHNGGTENVTVQVFDTTNKVIFPDTIQIVDINNITITFSAIQAGKALLTILI